MAQRSNPWMIATFVLIGVLVGIGIGIGLTQLPTFKNAGTAALSGTQPTAATQNELTQPTKPTLVIAPITAGDHVRGAAKPRISLIEFSDPECPFCKGFHATMKKIIAKYPNDVQWIYRHFPLDIHPKSPHEAEATECAAELGGNDGFWKYLDELFTVTPSDNKLDPAELPKIAKRIGLDQKQFEQCLSSGKYAGKVSSQLNEAVGAGAEGTPFSVVINEKGSRYPVSGALSFAQMDRVIQNLLAE